MVTSHLLAVPNTESTNCYNLWLACPGHLQPLARHSLCFQSRTPYPPLIFVSGFVSSASPQVLYNFGSSLRLLDLLLRAAFLGLEVIASVFLGASLMIYGDISLSNIAEIPNENHLVVQTAQNFVYQSVTVL